jgi:hypothetical protein
MTTAAERIADDHAAVQEAIRHVAEQRRRAAPRHLMRAYAVLCDDLTHRLPLIECWRLVDAASRLGRVDRAALVARHLPPHLTVAVLDKLRGGVR